MKRLTTDSPLSVICFAGDTHPAVIGIGFFIFVFYSSVQWVMGL